MDLIIQPTTGEQFTLSVWHFDTVGDIKEQIQKEQGISVSTQTLVFNGNVLDDEHELIYDLDIVNHSHIQLIIAPEPGNQSTNVLDDENLNVQTSGKRSINTEESSSSSKKIRLRIKNPAPNPEKHSTDTEESSSHSENIVRLRFKMPSSMSLFAFEMETNDTIRRVKEELQEIERHHWSRYILRANGIELLDDKTILDSGLTHKSEIEVSIKPLTKVDLPGPSGDVPPVRPKKLRVLISTTSGAEKIPLVVNFNDKVEELRKELEKLNQESKLELPPEYFFMHNRSVMKDDRSFRWHCVKDDDVIEYVPGRATSES